MSPPLILRFALVAAVARDMAVLGKRVKYLCRKGMKFLGAIRRIYTVLPTGELAMGLIELCDRLRIVAT